MKHFAYSVFGSCLIVTFLRFAGNTIDGTNARLVGEAGFFGSLAILFGVGIASYAVGRIYLWFIGVRIEDGR